MKKKNRGKLPLFIYFNKEPPSKNHLKGYSRSKKYFELFNITYTYRRDAVVSSFYGKFIPLATLPHDHSILQDKSIPKWKSMPDFLPAYILNRDISNKTKGILWIVSHCETESQREDYVERLRSHLPTLSIDILGRCGNDLLPYASLAGENFGNIPSYLELTQVYR